MRFYDSQLVLGLTVFLLICHWPEGSKDSGNGCSGVTAMSRVEYLSGSWMNSKNFFVKGADQISKTFRSACPSSHWCWWHYHRENCKVGHEICSGAVETGTPLFTQWVIWVCAKPVSPQGSNIMNGKVWFLCVLPLLWVQENDRLDVVSNQLGLMSAGSGSQRFFFFLLLFPFLL